MHSACSCGFSGLQESSFSSCSSASESLLTSLHKPCCSDPASLAAMRRACQVASKRHWGCARAAHPCSGQACVRCLKHMVQQASKSLRPLSALCCFLYCFLRGSQTAACNTALSSTGSPAAALGPELVPKLSAHIGRAEVAGHAQGRAPALQLSLPVLQHAGWRDHHVWLARQACLPQRTCRAHRGSATSLLAACWLPPC